MKLLSLGGRPVPCVQIEIYEGRGSAYAHGATVLGEGGRKDTGHCIYMTSKMEILNWVCCCSLSAVSLGLLRGRYTVQSAAGSVRSWFAGPRSCALGDHPEALAWVWMLRRPLSDPLGELRPQRPGATSSGCFKGNCPKAHSP